ncbi:hypothetical protein EST62_02615 [Chlorobaculum sp. 24CR]|uniref:hypothetical protein n=1 Tax=Chlorobaculum sp. 24CR TaxID=2508878 RepID=UPI00100A79AC|nr:hypothetical protein [Chlorobaculum sp. 24CR]RXK88551.1 hypothetical protein EST62_02615 [Chlorobaculum sp. 24CR]
MWRFTLIGNRELLGKLKGHYKKAFLESNNEALREIARQQGCRVLPYAPMLVIISDDPEALAAQYDCTLAMPSEVARRNLARHRQLLLLLPA